MKLIDQLSTHTEVLLSQSIPHLIDTRFFLQPLTTACLKPVLQPFLQEILTMHVMRVNEAVDLDLSTDPLEVCYGVSVLDSSLQ